MKYDVIVAGAGPVGLLLACELALARCKVLVLERAPNPDSPLKRLPFGMRGLNAPSIDALARRGLLDQLQIHKHLKNPHMKSVRQVGHFAGIPLLADDVAPIEGRELPVSLISEMYELETVFAQRAVELGVEIKRGHAVEKIETHDSGVRVDGYEASWLVGCDGARSVVRKAGAFDFAGTEPEFTGYTALVDLDDPSKLQAGRVVTERGMYLQSQPGYLILQDFDKGAFHASGASVTREHFEERLREISATDVTVNALHVATTWTDRARQATEYRRGRIFLAGDAAHIHSPLGGQGLNLGLGDAMSLGEKLARAVHGDESHVDQYELERYPLGERVLEWSRAQVALMRPDPGSRALNAIMREVMKTSATYFARRVWGLD